MKAILILFDTLCKRFLPMFGDKAVYAPNFERLAKKTVSFDNSYVSSMPCIPARRELHTGRRNFLHREWGPIEPFDDSMPQILKDNGVYTHLISDHIHYWEEGGGNYHTKYSTWEVVRGQEGDPWKGNVKGPNIPETASVPQNQAGTGVSSMWAQDWVNREYMTKDTEQPMPQVFDLGIEFIKKNWKEDNWFLQIETFDPHEPFYVMDHFREKYEQDYDGLPFDWPRGPVTETDEEVEHCINNYKALLTFCDEQLGRVLDLMDRLEMWEDTMLIVGTDHGFLLGEHGWWGKNQAPYFNEVAETPLFIYDPRSKIENESRQSLVQIIDWAPTLLEFFDVEIPSDMTGKPLRQVIEEDKPIRNDALFGVFSGHVTVIDDEYIYMRAAIDGKENDIYNYTLMPVGMHKAFDIENLLEAEFVEGFSFTKGLKVLKIPAKDKYGVNRFGNLLYSIKDDPQQLHPIDDEKIEKRMIQKLVDLMKKEECPHEQYERLGLVEYL